MPTRLTPLIAAALLVPLAAGETVITTDFSAGTDGTLRNGQVLTGDELSPFFTATSGGRNAGLTVFDTTPGGINRNSGDGDLLVGLGNALILQSDRGTRDQIQGDGTFRLPNDDVNGGSISFSFIDPVRMLAITLIDVDAGNGSTVTLTDTEGRTLAFDVPASWTNDVEKDGGLGYGVLDLTDLTPQVAEGGTSATSVMESGFDASSVVTLDVTFEGSGGMDNLRFAGSFPSIPTPATAAMLALTGAVLLRRHR